MKFSITKHIFLLCAIFAMAVSFGQTVLASETSIVPDNIEEYLSYMGTETVNGAFPGDSAFTMGLNGARVIGQRGTVSYELTTQSETQIRVMNWVSDEEFRSADFVQFLNDFTQDYVGEGYIATSYDALSKEVYVWVDYAHTSDIFCWRTEDLKIHLMWALDEAYVAEREAGNEEEEASDAGSAQSEASGSSDGQSSDIAAEPQPETEQPVAQEDPNATTAMKEAVEKAKDYISAMPFSYSGLKDQLGYDGFTPEEAAYGADLCGADWKEQAVLKAAQYLDTMSFSKDGLINQLLYDGFTEEQAEYGVAQNGF